MSTQYVTNLYTKDYASSSSSSRTHVIYHNWSAMKQRLHPQSVAEISRHSVLSGAGFDNVRHRLGLATRTQISVCKSPCRHRSVPVRCENGSAETTVAEGGRSSVADCGAAH